MTAVIEKRICARLARIETLLKRLDRLTAPAALTIPDHPLSLAEVATICRKDVKTVRRWAQQGKLAARQEGRAWFVLPSALRAFLSPHETTEGGAR